MLGSNVNDCAEFQHCPERRSRVSYKRESCFFADWAGQAEQHEGSGGDTARRADRAPTAANQDNE